MLPSVYWNAWTKRKVSSTDRPTGRSLTVTWRKFCFPSIMNKPLNEIPDSSCKTPYERAMASDLSANRGYWMFPNPPSFLGVLIQAKWVKCESVETPMTSQLIARNSCILSENAMISVGQTNVLEKKNRNGRSIINYLHSYQYHCKTRVRSYQVTLGDNSWSLAVFWGSYQCSGQARAICIQWKK